MAEKWSKIAMESCAPWESARTTAHFARNMVEKWRHIREETKRKMALLKRKTRLGQDNTHKYLSLCEALGPPRPLIFARTIFATHVHSHSPRSTGFRISWICTGSIGIWRGTVPKFHFLGL